MKHSRKPKGDNRRSVQRIVPPRLAEVTSHAQQTLVDIWLAEDGNPGKQILRAFRLGYDEGWMARGNDKVSDRR